MHELRPAVGRLARHFGLKPGTTEASLTAEMGQPPAGLEQRLRACCHFLKQVQGATAVEICAWLPPLRLVTAAADMAAALPVSA